MKVSVALSGVAQWSCGDVLLHEGTHEIDASPEVCQAIAAAAAAGVSILIVGADAEVCAAVKGAVESDKASLQRQPKLAADADDAAREAWAAFEEHQAAELARINAEIAENGGEA